MRRRVRWAANWPSCGAVFAAVLAASIGAAKAQTDARYDHRGSVGLLLGGGGEHVDTLKHDRSIDSNFRGDVDVGGTVAIGSSGNEWLLQARAILGSAPLGVSALTGYRGYFGDRQFKTFFDLGAVVHVAPLILVGPRVGFGAVYELTSNLGWYATVGVQLGFGGSFRFGAELGTGIQLRTYLFD